MKHPFFPEIPTLLYISSSVFVAHMSASMFSQMGEAWSLSCRRASLSFYFGSWPLFLFTVCWACKLSHVNFVQVLLRCGASEFTITITLFKMAKKKKELVVTVGGKWAQARPTAFLVGPTHL